MSCSVSELMDRVFEKFVTVSAKKLPGPRKFGGNSRWIAAEFQIWIDNGCPDQADDQE